MREIVRAARSPRHLAALLHGWQQCRKEDPNDGNDDEQVNLREGRGNVLHWLGHDSSSWMSGLAQEASSVGRFFEAHQSLSCGNGGSRSLDSFCQFTSSFDFESQNCDNTSVGSDSPFKERDRTQKPLTPLISLL